MKQLRLIVGMFFALSVFAASLAIACDGAKSTSAANAGSNCSMAGAKCTPEMKAACAASGMSCGKGSCATGAKATSAAASGSCQMHGTATAGGKCDMGSMANHASCVVCADQSSCDDDVRAAGAHTQVVALKNGAMIVYTADTPESVRALQAAVSRHNATVVTALNGQGQLCGECKGLRGAMASGKFIREIVNVQRGVQIVLTSSDRATVQRIHNMTGAQMATRVRG